MKITLRKRDRNALGILVLAVVLYFLASWLVLPGYRTLSGAESAALEKERILQKYRQVIGRKGRYSSLLEQAGKQVQQAEERVIRSEAPSLAAVEFQALVETAARKFDIKLEQRNVAPLPASTEPFREMTMTLGFEGAPGQLVSLLSELRMTPKVIRVLSLSISPLQPVQEAPKGGLVKDVRVSMTLGTWVQNLKKEDRK
jgi:hypothetical protein